MGIDITVLGLAFYLEVCTCKFKIWTPKKTRNIIRSTSTRVPFRNMLLWPIRLRRKKKLAGSRLPAASGNDIFCLPIISVNTNLEIRLSNSPMLLSFVIKTISDIWSHGEIGRLKQSNMKCYMFLWVDFPSIKHQPRSPLSRNHGEFFEPNCEQ